MNKYGAPTGFHHNLNGHWNEIYNVTKTKELKNGCYVAKWYNSAGKKNSSFFPNSMSRQEVTNSIKEAYLNLIEPIELPKKGIIKLVGQAKNGIIIEMKVSGNGVLDSAYPFIKEMLP